MNYSLDQTYANKTKMPRQIQSKSSSTFYKVTYIVPIIGDTDGLLAISERSYTYLLRNANSRLRPSQFQRHTVCKVFHFMIERLRKVRNITTKQVKIYGVEKFLALLKDVELKVHDEFSSLPSCINLSSCIRLFLRLS